MKITINYKGKMVEKEIPDAELEELVAEKKRTGYERAAGEEHYYVSNSFNKNLYSQEFEAEKDDDDNAFSSADYYTDERVARDNARADTLMRKLRRYAAEHGGIPDARKTLDGTFAGYNATTIVFANKGTTSPKYNWRNYGKPVDGNPLGNWILASPVGELWSVGIPMFSDVYAARNAIDEYWKELVWYFTEYEPQLR